MFIDNYDSFVYNLVQYIKEHGEKIVVLRNDEATVEEIKKMNPSGIVISPGPCTPAEAGVSVEIIRQLNCPILGVCLGHQAIGYAFGANIIKAIKPLHGINTVITNDQKGYFSNLPKHIDVCRYHSLVIDKYRLPSVLQVSAYSAEGEIMGIRHRSLPIEGVQFHPESIFSYGGKKIIKNFLTKTKRYGAENVETYGL